MCRKLIWEDSGRGDRIRTCDILLPKQARYRAALLPDYWSGALDRVGAQVYPA